MRAFRSTRRCPPTSKRCSRASATVDGNDRVRLSASKKPRRSRRNHEEHEFVSQKPRLTALAVVLLAAFAVPADSQTPVSSPDGRRQIAALPANGAITIDGVLDEEVWLKAVPASGFIQADPHEGQPASDVTEVKVAYDTDNLYVAVLCRDADPSGIVVNEIRKDFAGRDQDTFDVLLDTFGDRRNGFVFSTNAAGAKSDTQIANEGRDVNTNWDAVWWVESRRTPEGWTAEFRIPFKTLRFETGEGRSWGINFARRVRKKNEISYWSPVSRAYSIYRASAAGDLTGLPALRRGRNLRVKPFLVGGALRGVGEPEFGGDLSGGVDVKAGLTPSLTLDATINPDFAQAEADEQQVNLTQFSLFFPEKREFFLENSGIFYFGDIPRNQRQTARFRPPEEDLLLFFSRRIGLSDSGAQEPLYGGLRLTGRAGAFGVGLMTMQSEENEGKAGNNYTVVRVRRDVLRSSDVGAIVLSRQPSGDSRDFNRVAGLDANFRFFKSLSINGFAARSDSPGVTTNQNSGKASIGWEDSSKRLQASIMTIGEGFKDDLGFVRRSGVTRQFYDWASFLQPASLRKHGIRQIEPHARVFSYDGPNGHLVIQDGYTSPTRPRGTTDRSSNTHSSRAPRRSRGRLPLRRASSFRSAATTGCSTCCCSKAITAGRCRGPSARRWENSGAARRRPRRSACCTARATSWCSTSACRSATSISRCRTSRSPPRSSTSAAAIRSAPACFSTRCAVPERRQAVLRQPAVQPDPPPAQRLLHRLQRGAVHRYDADRRPRPGREVHPDVFVLEPDGTALLDGMALLDGIDARFWTGSCSARSGRSSASEVVLSEDPGKRSIPVRNCYPVRDCYPVRECAHPVSEAAEIGAVSVA